MLGFGEEEVRHDGVGNVGDHVNQKVLPAELLEPAVYRACL